MTLRNFKHTSASSPKEATAILSKGKGKAVAIAGIGSVHPPLTGPAVFSTYWNYMPPGGKPVVHVWQLAP